MPPRRQRGSNTPRDPANPGAVYGPRSALTSFLREQGITGPGASFTGRIRDDSTATPPPPPRAAPFSSGNADPATATSTTSVTLSTSVGDEDPDSTMTASPIASTSTTTTDAASPVASTSSSTATKRKPTKQATEAQLKRQKKVQEEGFLLAGKPEASSLKKGRYENRTPGAIAVCAECGRKFTVSKYTASNPNGPGMLCGACTTESIEDRATFPSASSSDNKAKQKKKKKSVPRSVEETLYKPVATLQQSCLSIISRYINDVDQLGDLGPTNLDRVAKIVCKNRALTSDNLKLFLDVGHRELKLYDCTNVRDTELATISIFCPHLERLTLNLCGRLDDDVLDQWERGFEELKHLSLYAPYLVTANKWKEFFQARHAKGLQLETFQLRMSSRFDESSLESFVSTNPLVVDLKLSELGRLTRDSARFLYPLGRHGQLRRLDLSRWGTPQGTVLEDEDVIDLLREVGRELDELNLDGNYNLTDRVLSEGVKLSCPHLTSLSLSDLHKVGPRGFETLFSDKPRPVMKRFRRRPEPEEEDVRRDDDDEGEEGTMSPHVVVAQAERGKEEDKEEEEEEEFERWTSPGLTYLNVHRCIDLDRQALSAMLDHSGPSLVHLSLHSLDGGTSGDNNEDEDGEIDSKFLTDKVAGQCRNLEVLDLSFVRSVDNFVVASLWRECPNLVTLFVHGNNRVTSDVPRKKDAQLRGLENAIHSEIPSNVRWES